MISAIWFINSTGVNKQISEERVRNLRVSQRVSDRFNFEIKRGVERKTWRGFVYFDILFSD